MFVNDNEKNKGTALGAQYNPNHNNMEHLDRFERMDRMEHTEGDNLNIFYEIY